MPANGEASREIVVAAYDKYIEYIRHENELLNYRTTWFITIQASLILAISFILQKFFDALWNVFSKSGTQVSAEGEQMIGLFCFIALSFCIIGCITAYASWRSIEAALKAQSAICQRWTALFASSATEFGLPDLMGGGDPDATRLGGSFARWIPPIMLSLWLILLVVAVALIGPGVTSHLAG